MDADLFYRIEPLLYRDIKDYFGSFDEARSFISKFNNRDEVVKEFRKLQPIKTCDDWTGVAFSTRTSTSIPVSYEKSIKNEIACIYGHGTNV